MTMETKPRLILNGAERYAELVLGLQRGTQQHTLAVQNFGAGAAFLFQFIMNGMSEGDAPTGADLALMSALDAECSCIGQALDKLHGEETLQRLKRGEAQH